MSEKDLKPDVPAALTFLSELLGQAHPLWLSRLTGGSMRTNTIAATDAAEIERWLKLGPNHYFSLNIVSDSAMKNKKAEKSDISMVRGLHVDCDPRALATIKGESAEDRKARGKLHTESQRARLLTLIEAYPLKPTAIWSSGGGYQAVWLFREPLDVPNGSPLIDEIESMNKRLFTDLDGDASAFNLDRILRLVGTVNEPNVKKQADGREPRLAELIHLDMMRRYDIADFRRHFAAPLEDVPAKQNPAQARAKFVALGDPLSVGTQELRDWAVANGKTLPDAPLARIADGDASTWDNDRSDMVFYVCAELLRAGVPKLLVASAIYDKGNPIHAHVWQQSGDRNRWRYAQRQVLNAEESNATKGAATGRDSLASARRAHQAEENRRIGEGQHSIPAAEVIELDTALARFVFCADGQRVVDVFHPHYDLPFSDWASTYAASKVAISREPKKLANGTEREQAPLALPMPKVWLAHARRQTVVTRTFKAGGPLVQHDPDGRLAVNSWRPFDRSLVVVDVGAARIGLFLDHVQFLFGEDTPRFLDWLAHIEQDPGVLPHTAWLHIGRRFGLGRNWLASVLTRVWAGSVAANFDLMATLESGFNGSLSRKVLAVVDEIREGGRDAQWDNSEKMKKIITEERRTINPKYGRQSIEYNACRWLLFSNHLSAIPMEDGDRRIEVVQSDSEPRAADYYTALYQALGDPKFIAAVASFLGTRVIAGFNPGAHARLSQAKRAAISASQSPAAQWCELIVKHWPCDVAPSSVIVSVLNEDAQGTGLFSGQRRALEQAGIEAHGKMVWIGSATRMSVIRNKARWQGATADEIRTEWRCGQRVLEGKDWSGWRAFLLGQEAAYGGDAKPKAPF